MSRDEKAGSTPVERLRAERDELADRLAATKQLLADRTARHAAQVADLRALLTRTLDALGRAVRLGCPDLAGETVCSRMPCACTAHVDALRARAEEAGRG